MKICSKCKTEKEFDQFSTDNRTPDKKKRWCKACSASGYLKWKKENPDNYVASYRKWQQANKDKTKKYDAVRYQRHREEILSQNKAWCHTHRERRREYNKQYLVLRPGLAAEYRRRYLSSLKNHLHTTVSRAILKSLRGNKGGVTWPKLVGYNTQELIEHLQRTMPEGYTWADYGKEKLHIDHIIPVAAFNFSSPKDIDFKKCWSLDNLRLLPAFDNMSKGDTLDKPFQPSLAIAA